MQTDIYTEVVHELGVILGIIVVVGIAIILGVWIVFDAQKRGLRWGPLFALTGIAFAFIGGFLGFIPILLIYLLYRRRGVVRQTETRPEREQLLETIDYLDERWEKGEISESTYHEVRAGLEKKLLALESPKEVIPRNIFIEQMILIPQVLVRPALAFRRINEISIWSLPIAVLIVLATFTFTVGAMKNPIIIGRHLIDYVVFTLLLFGFGKVIGKGGLLGLAASIGYAYVPFLLVNVIGFFLLILTGEFERVSSVQAQIESLPIEPTRDEAVAIMGQIFTPTLILLIVGVMAGFFWTVGLYVLAVRESLKLDTVRALAGVITCGLLFLTFSRFFPL